MNSIIAKEHDDGYSSVHKVLSFIPIIGDFLADVFKKTYSINNVKENSIFVFDDFERVTCCGISNRINIPYGYSHSSYSHSKRKHAPDIYDEFDKIKHAFIQAQEETIGLLDYAYMEKYNAIVGLVNELVEHYKMKVFIICNVDMLGHQYFNEIFRGKLNCLVYQKKVDSIQLSSVMKRVLDNHITEDTERKDRIAAFWENEKSSFEKIWKCYGNLNLRFLDMFFQAFIETTNNIKFEYIEDGDYVKAVFYSIFIVHCLSYEAIISNAQWITTGGSILFYLKCYDISDSLEKAFEKFPEIRWVDINISGNWILNKPACDISDDIYNRFKEYPFYALERQLINGVPSIIIEQSKCKINHIIFAYNKCNDVEKHLYMQCINKCDWWPEDCTDAHEVVKDTFDTLKQIRVGYDTDLRNEIYKKLYQKFKLDRIEGEEYFYEQYNFFVERIQKENVNENSGVSEQKINSMNN